MKTETVETWFGFKWGVVTFFLLLLMISVATLFVAMIFLAGVPGIGGATFGVGLAGLPIVLVGGSILLGWVQAKMLRPYVPGLRGWTIVTLLGMVLFIGFNFLFSSSLLGSSGAVDSLSSWLGIGREGLGRRQYFEVQGFVQTAVLLFWLTLTAFGFMSFGQWLLLQWHVRSAYWWLGGTVLSAFSGSLIGVLIGGATGAVVTMACIAFFQGLILVGLLKRQNQLDEPWQWDRYVVFSSSALGGLGLLVLIFLPTPFSGQPGAGLFASGCEQKIMADIANGRSGIGQLLSVRTSGHKDIVDTVTMLPNGQELLTTARDGTVRLWEWPCLQEKLIIPSDTNFNYAAPMSVTDDSRYIVTKNPGSWPIVVETMSGETVLEMDHAVGEALAVAPNGEYVAIPNKATISIHQLADGRIQCQFTAHQDLPITHVLFTPDSQKVVSVDFYGGLRVWNPATCSQSLAIPRPNYALDRMVVDPTGQFVAAVTFQESQLFVWDLTTGGTLFERKRVSEDFWRGDILFSADGRYLIAAGGKDSLRIWEWQENVERFHYKVNGLTRLTMTPDGSQLIAFTRDGEMRILNWQELVPQ